MLAARLRLRAWGIARRTARSTPWVWALVCPRPCCSAWPRRAMERPNSWLTDRGSTGRCRWIRHVSLTFYTGVSYTGSILQHPTVWPWFETMFSRIDSARWWSCLIICGGGMTPAIFGWQRQSQLCNKCDSWHIAPWVGKASWNTMFLPNRIPCSIRWVTYWSWSNWVLYHLQHYILQTHNHLQFYNNPQVHTVIYPIISHNIPWIQYI